MPTGYTAELYDGKDVSFEDFVWTCARAFGALVLLRDSPSDAPIPEQFEPSSHHVTKLAEAEQALAAFEGMSDEEQTEQFLAERAENLVKRMDEQRRRREMRDRYEAMLWQVETWEPPTEEHVGLKEFMVEQLTRSIGFDCHPGTDVYPPRLPERIEEWYDAKVKALRWDVDYHRKEHAGEVERTEGRNAWLAALRQSLNGARV